MINVQEEVISCSTMEPERQEISSLAVKFMVQGYSLEQAIKKAYTVINESRRFVNSLQEKRIQKINEEQGYK